MKNSKFIFFKKHQLVSPHTIVGGKHATEGTGAYAGRSDTFYAMNEGYFSGSVVCDHGIRGDVFFSASPDGGENPVPDDYQWMDAPHEHEG